MPVANNPNIELYLVLGIIAAVVLIFLIVGLAFFFSDFSRELKYLNTEINRTTGSERKRWIRRRRKLWLSIFPFVKY